MNENVSLLTDIAGIDEQEQSFARIKKIFIIISDAVASEGNHFYIPSVEE